MSWNIFKPILELAKYQKEYPLPHTKTTFKALVDAVVPRTSSREDKEDGVQVFGALDLDVDEYYIWYLNHYIWLTIVIKNFNIYLANATAEMLNIAARELIASGKNEDPVNLNISNEEGTFAALAPSDRFRTIALLEQLKVNLKSLPIPFYNNAGFVLATIGAVSMFAKIGYYSEWSGYDSTKLETPEKRKLEHFPIGWKQVGYPGPSKGYHVFRGYLTQEFTQQGGDT